LQKQSGGALSDALLKRIVEDSEGVERLRHFATQLGRNVALPPEARVRQVAARVFDVRAQHLGSRVSKAWVEEHVKGCGAINRGQSGCLLSGAVKRTRGLTMLLIHIVSVFLRTPLPSLLHLGVVPCVLSVCAAVIS
jgi:hypothetical protein